MADTLRVAPDGETPVNPYSLLEAVNDASDTAHTAWLIFLAIMTYFMIAVAGVTHKDLLLETPVSLPVMQVQIPITQFFQFAPIVLVMLHIGVLSQLVLLARKTLEFDHAIRLLETSDRRTHPLRLELSNFFFVQAIAGPHRSAIMSAFLHGMSWLTLVILPVVLILYIQAVFLPYHDETITWMHRIVLLIDIALLLLIGVFMIRTEPSFFQAFWRTTTQHPLSFFVTVLVLGGVAFLSFFAATIPGERLDRVTTALFGAAGDHRSSRHKRHESGLVLSYAAAGRSSGALLHMFHRHLDVQDADLVVDKDVTPGEPTINLRGRNLKLARLDRSDLHQADFTGADLEGASFAGADLRNVKMACRDLNEFLLSEDVTKAGCTSSRRANYTNARLDGAHLAGTDFTSATFAHAKLESAELTFARLTGADFTSANLDKADLTGGVRAEGVDFITASLRGTDLTGAKLQLADFSNTAMQGAILNLTSLEGAKFADADLEAAALAQARLQGADFSGARVPGADFRGSLVWHTQPPQADASGLADFSELAVRAPDEADVGQLQRIIERIDHPGLAARMKDGLAPLIEPVEARAWAGTPAQQRWAQLAAQPSGGGDTYRARITDYLVKEACKLRWANGALATGIARRATAMSFRGDRGAIQDRLKATDCPIAKAIPVKALDGLSLAAEIARAGG